MTIKKNKIINRNRVLSTAFMILILSFSASLTCIQFAKADDRATYAFISLVPNPVGINQPVDVTAFLQPIPPTGSDVFHGLMLTITKPDGTTETRNMDTSPIAMQFFVYTPTMTGIYEFKLTYPGETLSEHNYMPSESPITKLTVQDSPIQPYPENPVPTDYWTRPISARNRNWYTIAGNWLMGGYSLQYKRWDSASGFNPYSQAARSPHIMWTKEIQLGGLVGGSYGSTSYYSGLSYEPKMTPPIIMNGRIYYNVHESAFGTPGVKPGFACVDLRTGEEIWRKAEGTIDLGQLFNFVSGNQMGVIPYLWSIGFGESQMYDAFTGDLVLSFNNSVSPSWPWGVPFVNFGSDGTLFSYHFDAATGWLAMWNSTKALQDNFMIYDYSPGVSAFRPLAGTYDWMLGIEWNATVAPWQTPATIEALSNGVIVATNYDPGSAVGSTHKGYSATTGQELWSVVRSETDSYNRAFGEGIYAVQDTTKGTWNAYDLNTGVRLWESPPMGYPWGVYGQHTPVIAYGKLYGAGYDGYVHAYDIKTGQELWKAYSGSSGLETPYGSYPMYYGPIIADGVLYMGTGEHSPTQPWIRGEKLFAIDANNGNTLWSMTGAWIIQAIADGYLVGYNAYDNRMYCIGKGPSKLEVSAPQTSVAKGSTVLIQGKVTDQSSGQEGTPCVSKESMSAWMTYLKQQEPMPSTVTGVPVNLKAVKADGNAISIGTVMSDLDGFRYEWTPSDTGLYKIVAEFAGDESYGSSTAATGLSVNALTSTSSTASSIELYLLIATIVVIIAIAIVGLLILRKRT